MDVVAGRKTCGRISGAITANGQPLSAAAFSRLSGYVSAAAARAASVLEPTTIAATNASADGASAAAAATLTRLTTYAG